DFNTALEDFRGKLAEVIFRASVHRVSLASSN
ncbi:unnamed protein product, partial [marine sediment metagenome]